MYRLGKQVSGAIRRNLHHTKKDCIESILWRLVLIDSEIKPLPAPEDKNFYDSAIRKSINDFCLIVSFDRHVNVAAFTLWLIIVAVSLTGEKKKQELDTNIEPNHRLV